jgi:hypothetical protein
MMTKVPQPPSGTAEGPDLSETLFPTEDQVHQRCNCQLCLNGVLREDGIGEMSINGVIRRTRCNKWYEAACDFPETCDEFRAGVGTECCDNTQSPINQTKAPNVAPTSAPEEVKQTWLIESCVFIYTKFLSLNDFFLFLVCLQPLS